MVVLCVAVMGMNQNILIAEVISFVQFRLDNKYQYNNKHYHNKMGIIIMFRLSFIRFITEYFNNQLKE